MKQTWCTNSNVCAYTQLQESKKETYTMTTLTSFSLSAEIQNVHCRHPASVQNFTLLSLKGHHSRMGYSLILLPSHISGKSQMVQSAFYRDPSASSASVMMVTVPAPHTVLSDVFSMAA